MGHYRFVSSWMLETDLKTLWQLIDNFEQADCWQNCTFCKIKEGDSGNGVGDMYLSMFRANWIYRLSFITTVTRKYEPHLLELEASGELEGRGVWSFQEQGNNTEICFVWEVRTTKRWMNIGAPLFRRAFKRSHDRIMQGGVQDICRHLGVRLLHSLSR